MNNPMNPFGKKQQSQRPPVEILKSTFSIGIQKYDRGAYRWDPNRIKDGEVSPGWVKVVNESEECVVRFSANEGQGTGAQTIPANEFVEYVNALQTIIDSDFEENQEDRTQYIPTYTVASNSFKLIHPKVQGPDGKWKTDRSAERNMVSVRSTNGQGSKPIVVSKEDFVTIVNALKSVADNIDEYESNAWAAYSAEMPNNFDAE